MHPETRQLVTALSVINHKVPEVGLALMEGRLSTGQQIAFAGLLDELARLLRRHALDNVDLSASNIPIESPEAPP